MNDVEKKIYEAGRLHPISQSSDHILEAFKTKHPRRFQKKYFFIPAITTLLTSAVAVAVIFALNPRPIHIEGQTKGVDDGTSVLTSLVSDLSLHYFVQPQTVTRSITKKAAPTQDDFVKAVVDVDSVYNQYNYYNVHRDGFNYSFDSTKFSFADVNYHYELSVNNTTVYLKDNISDIDEHGSFEGLIRIDDNCYPCTIESKVNRKNVYTTFKYYVNSTFYVFSHETLNQKTTISHKTYVDDELAEVNSVVISYNKNVFNASFIANDKVQEIERERSFTSKENENFVNVDYTKRSESNNIHFENIKLRVGSHRVHNHTYSLEGMKDIVL